MRILKDECDLDEFVISKSLRRSYKNEDSLGHVVLAKKMRKRIENGEIVMDPPRAGDRINYVIVEPPKGSSSQKSSSAIKQKIQHGAK